MELHASLPEDADGARRFADEVRAELARKRLTANDLARVLSLSPQTVGRRLKGEKPFNAIEMVIAARFMRVELSVLWARATSKHEAIAS